MSSQAQLRLFEEGVTPRRMGTVKKVLGGATLLAAGAGAVLAVQNSEAIGKYLVSLLSDSSATQVYASPEQAVRSFYSTLGIENYDVDSLDMQGNMLVYAIQVEDPDNPGSYTHEKVAVREERGGWVAYREKNLPTLAEQAAAKGIEIPYREPEQKAAEEIRQDLAQKEKERPVEETNTKVDYNTEKIAEPKISVVEPPPELKNPKPKLYRLYETLSYADKLNYDRKMNFDATFNGETVHIDELLYEEDAWGNYTITAIVGKKRIGMCYRSFVRGLNVCEEETLTIRDESGRTRYEVLRNRKGTEESLIIDNLKIATDERKAYENARKEAERWSILLGKQRYGSVSTGINMTEFILKAHSSMNPSNSQVEIKKDGNLSWIYIDILPESRSESVRFEGGAGNNFGFTVARSSVTVYADEFHIELWDTGLDASVEGVGIGNMGHQLIIRKNGDSFSSVGRTASLYTESDIKRIFAHASSITQEIYHEFPGAKKRMEEEIERTKRLGEEEEKERRKFGLALALEGAQFTFLNTRQMFDGRSTLYNIDSYYYNGYGYLGTFDAKTKLDGSVSHTLCVMYLTDPRPERPTGRSQPRPPSIVFFESSIFGTEDNPPKITDLGADGTIDVVDYSFRRKSPRFLRIERGRGGRLTFQGKFPGTNITPTREEIEQIFNAVEAAYREIYPKLGI